MTAKKKARRTYEEGVRALEEMIGKLEDGALPLDEAIAAYEAGVALADELDAELREHGRRIEQIDPQTGEVSPLEEA